MAAADSSKINETLATYFEEYKQSDVVQIPNLVEAAFEETNSLKFEDVLVCTHLSNDQVAQKIEAIMAESLTSITNGEIFEYKLLDRSPKNLHFIKSLGYKVLKKKVKKVSYNSMQQYQRTTSLTKILSFIHKVCIEEKISSKRALCYNHRILFEEHQISDSDFDDVAYMLGCFRSDLPVLPAFVKGEVIGKLSFKDNDDGKLVDCDIGRVGKSIKSYMIESISEVKVKDAKFILLVEKEAVFNVLAQERFHDTYPCIIITSKGQPDIATRQLVHYLNKEFRLPVLGLVDCDPSSMRILSVFKFGSDNLVSYQHNLIIPDLKWIGVFPGDLVNFNIPDRCRLPVNTDTDTLTLKRYDFWPDKWKLEFDKMRYSKLSTDILSLARNGLGFLTEVYLPSKLKDPDQWL